MSFSKQVEEKPQQQIAATLAGKSVIINKTSSDTETYPKSSDDISQLHDQSKQNGIHVDDNNEAQITATNQGKSVSHDDPRLSTIDDSASPDAVQKLLSYPSDKQIGQECSSCLELQDKVIQLSEALQRISMQTADQIPTTEFEFTIPKEKYEMVRDAMDKSTASIFVKCDESKFVRAVSDVDN